MAGTVLSTFVLLDFPGVLLAAYASDRLLDGRRFPLGAAMMFALAISCLLFPVVSPFSQAGLFLLIGSISMLISGPKTLMTGAATQEAATPETTARAAAFVDAAGQLGGLASAFVVAPVLQFAGWNGLFSLYAAFAALGGVALARHWKTKASIAADICLDAALGSRV